MSVARVAARVGLGLLLAMVLLAVGGSLLFLWVLNGGGSSGSSVWGASVGEELRGVAQALRDEKVRTVVNRGASSEQVAALVGASTASPAELRTATAQDLSRLILTQVSRTGRSGVAVDLVTGGISTSGGLFGGSQHPWVGCFRVELPRLAVDATQWMVTDADCPTFSRQLQQAERVHADFAARPLLRPPCYGTTGYCPGG